MSTQIYTANSSNLVTSKVSCTYNDAKDEASTHFICISDNATRLRGVIRGASYLSGIQSVTLGPNMLSVADYSFEGCTQLKTFQPNDRLKYIGVSAFCNCISLKSFELPLATRNIRTAAFINCQSVETIDFPEKVANYGASAFMGCSGLKSVSVDVSASSDSCVFMKCTSLDQASVKRTLTRRIFMDDTSLKSVSCYALSVVPEECFRGCTSLTSVHFQKHIAKFDDACFYQCKSLSSFDMSKHEVTSLPSKFLHGTKVSSLVLPSTLENISKLDSMCFDGMTELCSVKFLGMNDEYMHSNSKKFNRFSCPHNYVVYSSNGTRYELKSNGNGLKLNGSDTLPADKVSNIQVVTVAHAGAWTTHPLNGMSDDIRRVCGMVDKATNGTSLDVTYQKFGDSGQTGVKAATSQNVLAALDAAIEASPDLLVFHFSDHGDKRYSYGQIVSGVMVMQDANDYLAYQTVVDKLINQKKVKRVFMIMCCCYPMSGVNVNIPKGGPSMLVWCAGPSSQVTFKEDSLTGHKFITCMVNSFNGSMTYKQLWNAMENSGKFVYTVDGHSASPQRYNYNNFNEDNRAFM